MQTKEYFREYHERNKKYRSEQRISRYQRMRLLALDMLGNKCANCGYDTDIRALQIDHINGGGRKEMIEIGTYGILRNVINEEPGYQLLCANCNQIKRFENDEG